MNHKQIRQHADKHEKTMTKFLRDLVAIPGESGGPPGDIPLPVPSQ